MLIGDYFPYYQYQNHIIYILSGEENFKDSLPMSVRYLGIYLQLLIYKIVPCFKLTGIDLTNKHELYECTTLSLATLNYICKYLFYVVFFFYLKNKLNRGILESFVGLIFASIFFQYLENFTLDRLAVLYLTIVLYYLNNFKISNILILLSFLVNEKIIIVLGPLFFFRYIFYKKNISALICSSISVFLYLFMIFIVNKYFGYRFSEIYDGAGFDRIILNIFNKSHISNSILPIIFCILPYIISIILKNKFNHKYSNLEIIIPLIMWILAYGGGENNIGRYVMHTLPLWIPIFSSQLVYFLKIKKIF
tara:strand:+ start:754 stop:1674 length:921 start_codon:yes stop_codon:yes gene_type:complete